MNEVTMVGLDLAKNVFQVHGVDSAGQVVLRRKLRRDNVEDFFRRLPPLTIGMEACGGAHYWGRLLEALGHRPLARPMQGLHVKLVLRLQRDKAHRRLCRRFGNRFGISTSFFCAFTQGHTYSGNISRTSYPCALRSRVR